MVKGRQDAGRKHLGKTGRLVKDSGMVELEWLL